MDSIYCIENDAAFHRNQFNNYKDLPLRKYNRVD